MEHKPLHAAGLLLEMHPLPVAPHHVLGDKERMVGPSNESNI